MSKKPLDRVEVLEKQVSKLQDAIRKKDKTIKQLKSQFDTVDQAWRTTEIYLKEVTDGKPLSEVLKTVESGRPLSKLNAACPKCNSYNMKQITFTGFYIVSCSGCGYRNKIDEENEITKTERD